MTKKERFEQWVEENKTSIAYWTGAAVGLTGAVLGFKWWWKSSCGKNGQMYVVLDKGMQNTLDSIMTLTDPINVVSGRSERPYKVSELGEFGKEMIEAGINADWNLDHFICAGEQKK